MRIVSAGALSAMMFVTLSASTCAHDPTTTGRYINGILDPIQTLTVPASNDAALTYANSTDFDLQLHASMKGSTSPISVTVPAAAGLRLDDLTRSPTISNNDERLGRWLYKIGQSDGRIFACADEEPETGFWTLLAILADIALPMVNDFLTYRPAENYHAVIFYDRASEAVRSVKMIRRASVNADTLTCAAAKGL